jgi:hypothetical protein
LIERFYKIFDYILYKIVSQLVNVQIVKTVLKKEINLEDESKVEVVVMKDSFLTHLDMIHSRVSTLIGHVSIMLAVLMYSLSIYPKGTIQSKVALIELSLYLFCTIVCIRCLRAYGFDDESKVDRNTTAFNDHRIKVERPVTRPSPRRSRRAVLPHRALRIRSLTH